MISPVDLKYFLEVAKTQNVSRSAERLGITQPALSHCLKRIEEEMGCSLFVRSKKGVTLTSPGKKLLQQAHDLVIQWDRLKSSVTEDLNEVTGVIQLGCHTAVAQYTLPEVLPELLRDYPKLKVELHHGLSRHLTEQVVSSHLDVAFAVNPVAHPDLIIKEVCRDQVTIWRSRQCVNPDTLLIDPSLLQTQELLRKSAKRGLHFNRTLESSSLEVLAQLLVAGSGCAILPKRVIKALSNETVEPVKTAPVLDDRICLVFKREFIKIRRGKVFVERVMGEFK